MRFDDEVAAIFSELPQAGPLFPYLRRVRSCDRATEFKQRCEGLETKHGNPRLRHTLIETAWRLARFQPEYRAVQRWIAVLSSPARHAAARKKAIVAVARQLAVDLWRIRTGRVAAEALGLHLNFNPTQEVTA